MKLTKSRNKSGYFVLLVFVITLTAFLALLSQNFQRKEDAAIQQKETAETIPPQINTAELPNAKTGVSYRAAIIASIFLHTELSISAEGLPEGLSLTDCTNEADVKAVPKTPNTLAKCLITGIPTKSGSFSIKIESSTKDSRTNAISNLTLKVTN